MSLAYSSGNPSCWKKIPRQTCAGTLLAFPEEPSEKKARYFERPVHMVRCMVLLNSYVVRCLVPCLFLSVSCKLHSVSTMRKPSMSILRARIQRHQSISANAFPCTYVSQRYSLPILQVCTWSCGTTCIELKIYKFCEICRWSEFSIFFSFTYINWVSEWNKIYRFLNCCNNKI